VYHPGRLSRSERILLGTLAALSLLLRALAFFRYRFDSDEAQHLHVSWGWTAGLVQYRDLFDNHAPLFHILTSPLLRMAGERPDVLLYMRAPMLILFAIVLGATWYLARRMYSTRVAAWSTVLLSLFSIFFLKSLEFRTDNLWNAVWAIVIVVLVAGEMTVVRSFVTGLLLGIALCVSLKTVLLIATLLLAFAATWTITRTVSLSFRALLVRALAAAAGFAIVPAIVLSYFRSVGAWDRLVYCVFTFNELIMKTRDGRLGRYAYPVTLAIVLWSCWIWRKQVIDEATRWRYFFATAIAMFSITLVSFWVLISPRDMLPIMPLGMIFFTAALLRLRRPMTAIILFSLASFAVIVRETDRFRDHTTEEITMMRQVLGVSRPGEPLMDLKGETIFRRRPFYNIFEFITRAQMEHGMIKDTIPEAMLASGCHVAQADGPFFPERGRAFMVANFIDLGRLRASGQWLGDDGSFSIAIPGDYVVLTERGPARGNLDGTPYDGARHLGAGNHRFESAAPGRLACLWAPAFARGYSPFHLRDREF
jgi:hypothetical protein